MPWPTGEQPFGPNHAPLLAGIASDGSKDSTGKFLAVPVAVDKASGAVVVEVEVTAAALPATMVNGQQTATGSAVALSSGALTQGVIIEALSSNTTSIYIGGSGVSSSTGYELQPGASVGIAVNNTNLIYIICSTASQVITWVGS